jgi:competence protein ComEA
VSARIFAAALLLAAMAMLAWPHEPARPPRHFDCTNAVRVEGQLRCGAEVPRTVGELCGDARTGPIAPGDDIDRAVACSCLTDDCERARIDPDELALLRVSIDINAAGVAELASLPGVGPVIAERIVAARPFARVEQLEDVRGIGPRTLERMRSRVRLR